jgi:hypothetical protein
MAKYPKIGTAQSTSIDETGMTQSISQDQASLSDEVWNDADICQITGPEQKGGCRSFKSREGSFEVHMRRESSTDQARSSGPNPVLFRCMYRSADDFRMSRKSQVIIGGQQDDFTSCILDGRPCA